MRIWGPLWGILPFHLVSGTLRIPKWNTKQKDEHDQLAVKFKLGELNTTRDWLDGLANQIAEEHDLLNHGQVGELVGHYLFTRKPGKKNKSDKLTLTTRKNHEDHEESEELLEKLKSHPDVEYYAPQVRLIRDKRNVIDRKSVSLLKPNEFHHQRSTEDSSGIQSSLFSSLARDLKFSDPQYPKQWHLKNQRYIGNDCNVTSVWEYNITGKGVVVAVVDDGVQWNHPDLFENYSPEGSFDLNSNDNDPMPEYDEHEENKHGTRCAGEIAAVPNNVCGVGVAFGAKFSGIRVLDGPITDSMEATAFNKHLGVNDIYSCSWGPEDDAKTLDGPHPLAQAALIHGVSAGRRGFGSIYIVASGNGGAEGDNCNFDGYANSIYTITIGAVDEKGDMPYYAEECASMLASTFSSGHPQGRDTRKIVTTDWTMGRSSEIHGCTDSHTGTSAATPLAAGMTALMLEVRPCLTWRDVQHIIVFTARQTKGSGKARNHRSWITNGAGFKHSTQYGFGLLDAWRLVNAAKIWKRVPILTSFSPPTIGYNEKIPKQNEQSAQMGTLRLSATVSARDAEEHKINTLEHVQITLTIEHGRRGDVEVIIACPSGTESLVGPNRDKDDSDLGFKDWTFSTVRCWGESPVGTFQLFVRDKGNQGDGLLRYWKLTLYGSAWSPKDVRERRIEVENSYSGEFIDPARNFSLHCPPGESLVFDITTTMSDRTLKLIALMSGLFVFWSIYYSLEMTFCSEEKVSIINSITNSNPSLETQDLVRDESGVPGGDVRENVLEEIRAVREDDDSQESKSGVPN